MTAPELRHREALILIEALGKAMYESDEALKDDGAVSDLLPADRAQRAEYRRRAARVLLAGGAIHRDAAEPALKELGDRSVVRAVGATAGA